MRILAFLTILVLAPCLTADNPSKAREALESTSKFSQSQTKVDPQKDSPPDFSDQVMAALSLARAGIDLTKVHPCDCGCSETGVCTCQSCNVGCGFEVKKEKPKPKAVPADPTPKKPAQPIKQESRRVIVSYRTECVNGSCTLIPIYGDSIQSPTQYWQESQPTYQYAQPSFQYQQIDSFSQPFFGNQQSIGGGRRIFQRLGSCRGGSCGG